MRLYIIRHGKAHQDSPSGGDDDRALKERGRRQAAWLGEWFASGEQTPGLVLSSPILRARQTAEILVEVCGAAMRIEEDLSTASLAGRVMDLVAGVVAEWGGERGEGEGLERLAIVGHNPTLEVVAGTIGGGVGGGVRIRTGEMVVCEVERGIQPGGGRIVEVVRLEE